MANVKIKPIGDRVLVEHIEEKEQVRGGIIIPDRAKEKRGGQSSALRGQGRRPRAHQQIRRHRGKTRGQEIHPRPRRRHSRRDRLSLFISHTQHSTKDSITWLLNNSCSTKPPAPKFCAVWNFSRVPSRSRSAPRAAMSSSTKNSVRRPSPRTA